MKNDIPSFSVTRSANLYDVLKCIDRSARFSIALVVDEDQRLVATITDGDIRRAIIAGFSLDSSVQDILPMKEMSPHPRPVTAPLGLEPEEMQRLMQDQAVRTLVLVNELGQPEDLVAGGIALSEPEIRGNEWKYVKECLDTAWVSSAGKYVDRLERNVASKVHSKYGVAAVSGTAALHIALLATGVQPDDEVLTSALTFIAPANAIRYTGAWPVFMDAEPDYWQMNPEQVREFLEKECRSVNGSLVNRVTGRRIKAILPVHILGHPVDMDPILELANRFDLSVIEDATESLGAKYKGRPTGSLADIACFSFNGNKIITTGGGGMITTSEEKLATKAKHLTTQAKQDPIEFVHDEVGYNYRLPNLLAAVGVAQLELLDEYIAAKRRIAQTYTEALHSVSGVKPMLEADWASSTFWMYTILIDEAKYGISSRELIRKLDEANIQARPLWQPMHRSPAMKECQDFQCEVADNLNQTAVSLPCSVGLTQEQQKRVIDVVLSAAG